MCLPDDVSHAKSGFSENSGGTTESLVFAPPRESVVTCVSVVSEVFATPGESLVTGDMRMFVVILMPTFVVIVRPSAGHD